MTTINVSILIRQTEAKLDRQRKAVQDTETNLAALREIQRQQDAANTQKK